MRTPGQEVIKAGILKSALNAWDPRATTRVLHIPSGCLDRCFWGLFIRPELKHEGNTPTLLREEPFFHCVEKPRKCFPCVENFQITGTPPSRVFEISLPYGCKDASSDCA